MASSRPAGRRDLTAALIKHVLFPAWAAKNRSPRLVYAAEFERTQFLPPDALQRLQWRRFTAVLRHAYDHSPFYRRRMREAGVTPDDIRSPEHVAALPTTSRADVQEAWEDMIAVPFRDRPLLKDMTGGSTGIPMVFYYDEDRLDSRVAATIRHNRWIGWDIGDRMAVLWGAPRDLSAPPSTKARVRDWILDRRIMLDASAIDEACLHAFHRRLMRRPPRFVLAYANTMALFARFVRDTGAAPIRPEALICSGEMLTPENRELIESTFECRVFDRYGSRELAVIASECDRHRGMHVNAENLLVEVLANGRPCAGEDGEIVVTDLRNYAMPFIRYRTMDVGRMRTDRCDCGRSLPLLDIGGGRMSDFLTAMSGQKVAGIAMAAHVATDLPGIHQVQFVQNRRGAVTARVVRGPAWSDATAAELAARLRGFLGAAMVVDVEFAERIAQEASGKYRFSISTVDAVPHQT